VTNTIMNEHVNIDDLSRKRLQQAWDRFVANEKGTYRELMEECFSIGVAANRASGLKLVSPLNTP
jgi:hypothetical protein